jgi:hypothetical protein
VELVARWYDANERVLLEALQGGLWRGFPVDPATFLDPKFKP